MYLLGIPAEVVVTVASLNLLYQYWVHTEHIPKLGWYEWVFVTPSNHRVHHAQNDRYVDRNYGGVFIVWDRMFGTFQEELSEDPPIYGIRGPLRSFNPFKALTHIYVDMARDSWHTERWRDKLKVWIARTGWRPADVARKYPREKADLAVFEKYDPQVGRGVSLYAFFQLVVVILLLNRMQASELAYLPGLLLWGSMLATTITTALWLDGRPGEAVARWDFTRLAGIAMVTLIAAFAGYPSAAVALGAAYVALNAVMVVMLSRRKSLGQGVPSAA